MNILKFLSVFLCFLMVVSCGNNTPAPKAIVVPSMIAVERGVSDVSKLNKDAKTTIDDQSKIIKDQKKEISNAVEKSKLLKENVSNNKPISQHEVDELFFILKSVEDRNMFIEEKNNDLFLNNKIQTPVIDRLKDDTEFATDQSIKKELETDELERKIIKQDAKIDSLSVYKRWVWGVIIIVLLFFIVKTAFRFYNPL